MEEPGAEVGCIVFEMLIRHLQGNVTWIGKVSLSGNVDLVVTGI